MQLARGWQCPSLRMPKQNSAGDDGMALGETLSFGVAKKSGVSPHDLVDDLAYIRKRAEDVLQAALEGEKLTVALTAIREFRETVLSIAKLTHADAALDPMRILALQSEVKDRILKSGRGISACATG